jgi:hypothetical protein
MLIVVIESVVRVDCSMAIRAITLGSSGWPAPSMMVSRQSAKS